MKEIKLTRGKTALVDDKDFDWLNKYSWYAYVKSKTHYARTEIKGVQYSMHRMILGLERGDKKHCDHINGKGFDNQRSNLRVVTHQQNCFNRKTILSISGYKGVSLCRGYKSKKWLAYITINQKQRHIGRYATKVEAARAYNEAAKKYFGEFAYLNVLA